MHRLIFALAFSLLLPTKAAWAMDDGSLRLQSLLVFQPLGQEDNEPRLALDLKQLEVRLLPLAVDSRRAFLLDISEEEFAAKPQLPVRNVWDRIRNGFALPPLKSPLVAEREHWFGQRKELVTNVSHRARRYLFHIVESIEKRGMPMEFALLPFIESGFDPVAMSSAEASGLWQFIPDTAQRYGLKSTAEYDARRDILASTEAALDYLQFLYDMFKDWHLALASYNWGEKSVMKAVLRNQAKGLPTDYESLVMPDETRYYVPKLMAIRNIVLNPELLGIELVDIPNAPYFSRVDVAVPLDIKSLAKMAGLTAAEVMALNPSHNTASISGKGKPAVLIPTGQVEVFAQNIADYSARARVTRKPAEVKEKPKSAISVKAAEAKKL